MDFLTFDMNDHVVLKGVISQGALLQIRLRLKHRSHLAKYFVRLLTIEINSAIANNLKPIRMMKMQCVTIYPNNS